MATIKATGSKGHHTFTLNVWENSTSVANNTSNCGYSFTMYGGTYAFNWTSKSISWGLNIGGKTYSGSFGKYDKNTTLTISSNNSISIAHNDDGTKNIGISFWVSDGINLSYTTGDCSASGNMSLTDIPRKATITSVSDFSDTQNPVFYFSNPGGFWLQFKLEVNGDAGFITRTDVKGAASPYTLELTDSEIEKLINASTNSSKLDVRMTISTSIGGKYVYWDWKDKYFYITERSETKPSVSLTYELNNGDLPSTFDGLYIQGKSRLNVTLSAVGKYNASIKSYSALIDGKTYTSSSFTSNVIDSFENVDIIGYAKDSREFTGSASEQINVIQYSKPSIIKLSGENAISCYRSDGNGTRVGNSTSVWIKAKLSFSTVVSDGTQKNFCSLQWRRKLSTEIWSDTAHTWENLITSASEASDYNALLPDTVFDVKKSYTVQIMAIDTIGETDIKTFDIPTQDVALHLGKGGKNVSIGAYCDYSEDYTFYSDWKAIFDKGLTVSGSPLADFIVEQGVSDIWTYRKWYSGIAECWGFLQEEGIVITTPQRGAYMSATMTKTLPFAFYGTSIISGHVSNSMWFGNTWVSSGTNTLNYTISRATAADSDSCDIRMFIIGKWK